MAGACRRVAIVTIAGLILGVSLTGCITINAGGDKGASSFPTQSAPAPAPTVDYSGALTQLGSAIGALAKSSGTAPSDEDCGYTAYVADQMEGATPDPAWQGTYETIRSNMQGIGALCIGDPTNQDAIDLATLTRVDVVKILNAEEYLGQSNWS